MERILNLLWGVETARWVDRFLPFLFMLCALPVMIFIAIAAPPGQSPDETAHAIRADSLLHGQFVSKPGPVMRLGALQVPTANVMADLGTATIVWDSTTPAQYYGAAAQARLRAIPWSGRALPASVPNTGTYPPFLYIPMAAAEGVMHGLGHGPYDAFLAERLTNAVCFVSLGVWALLLARRGKFLLFGLLLLPSSLWFGATLHTDGVMIGLSVLAAALLTRADHSRRCLWGGATALCFVILARPPVIPLALILFLPLWSRTGGIRQSIGPFLLTCVPGLIWMGFVIRYVAVPFFRPMVVPGGPLWDGDPSRLFYLTDSSIQLHILLSHPGRLITVPLESLLHDWRGLLAELFRVVGAISLVLPTFMEWICVFAIAAALLGQNAPGRGYDLCKRYIQIFALVAFGLIVLIYDAEYISWTPVGAALVDGVQGRYFVEFLPFLALLGVARPARPVFLLPALTLAAANLVVVPWAVLQAYYVK